MDPEHVKKYGIAGVCWANGRQTDKYTVPLYARSTPAPGPDDETYYTKGKDAPWFEALDDKTFAWEATTLAMHLNDTGLGDDLDKWFPFQAVISDAADRIERLLATPAQAVAPTAGVGELVERLKAAGDPRDQKSGPSRALYREAATALASLSARLEKQEADEDAASRAMQTLSLIHI